MQLNNILYFLQTGKDRAYFVSIPSSVNKIKFPFSFRGPFLFRFKQLLHNPLLKELLSKARLSKNVLQTLTSLDLLPILKFHHKGFIARLL